MTTQQLLHKFLTFNYFQGEGISVALVLLFFLELIFIYLIINIKKDKNESWFGHALGMKMLSILLLLLCLLSIWCLIICILFLAMGIEEIVNLFNKDVLYYILGVIVWFYANYLIAKNFGEEDKPKEYKPRKKKRKKR